MHPTAARFRMASTKAGMRRILKNRGPVINYIRQAVETGVYRSNEEIEKVWKERREGADDLRTVMKRFRQNIVRGSNVHDYPVEYVILKKHPPIPDPPRIPARIARRMKEPLNPTEALVEKHLRRQEEQRRRQGGEPTDSQAAKATSSAEGGPGTTEEYYRRLFGAPAPPLNSALGQKTARVQRAYAAAVKQYELQRTEGLSESEALARVDALLAEQDRTERTVSRLQATQAQAWKQQQQSQQQLQKRSTGLRDNDPLSSIKKSKPTAEPEGPATSDLLSIFGDDPRGIEGMMIWSERLAAVPYHEWTVGASTAMDHWIARRVLKLSEESWQALLEGDDPNLLSRGRDIIVVRESLFPETIDPNQVRDKGLESEQASETTKETSTPTLSSEKSIEELLASIGGLSIPESSENKKKEARSSRLDEDDVSDLDAKVERLVNELQEWRRMNQKKPYKDWGKQDKDEFNTWMKRYVDAVSSNAARGEVDYDSTREALLSQPPLSADDALEFWTTLQDEGRAAELLDQMREHGPPPGATFLHAAFWELPYEQQLGRLLNLGAIRPLLDEYSKESDRIKFLQRYGDTLLTGVELEHLVPDPEGPVRASDIGSAAAALGVKKDDRFRLVMVPYRATENMPAQEKTRALFAAWNQHKAGRARYEEKLFKTGRLGLRYSDEVDDN